MPQFPVESDIARASTISKAFYTDAGVFQDAKERIFARSWQWLADADVVKVPGQVYPITMLEGCLDEPIVLTRDTDDVVHCISNVCTHRGNLVVEGAGNERFLRCRYHGKRFGLDGCFQSMPEFEGCVGFPSPADSLHKVPFALWQNQIFASLEPVCPLDEWIAPMIERVGWLPLDHFRREPTRSREYMVRANWALYCDNYLEGFHIPFVHADLNAVIDYASYTVEMFRYCNLQIAVSKGGEDVFDLPTTSPDYGRAISAYYFWVFPNMMFNFYPWGLSINIVRPLAVDLTKISFIAYVWDETKLGRGAGGALDRVEREDEAVVELVQKGLHSRYYERGRFSPTRETGTHHFHTLLSEFMG